MGVNSIPSAVDIAISGLRAESARMNVIAGNIANSKTSRTPSGQPYRRQEVILSTGSSAFGGPEIMNIAADMSTEFKEVHQPGHPDANDKGFVKMPNVDLPIEMINLTAASRAYQANAAVMKRHQEIVEAAIALLK
ncbi:MAG: flagellar basal body rod protein FlgC [Phycisphaerales bacterium]|jgi:flagellar basal-body rod protein FlgC|nr:flagellar basal body rod protein FlgC [Phycisphaerales bacterium]